MHGSSEPAEDQRRAGRRTLFRACVCIGCDSTNLGWMSSGVMFSSGCEHGALMLSAASLVATFEKESAWVGCFGISH